MKSQMWQTTVYQCGLIIIFSVAIISFIQKQMPLIALVHLLLLTVAVIGLALLMTIRKSPNQEFYASVLYLGNVVFVAFGISVNQEAWLLSEYPFQAFMGIKFTAILIAMQAPPIRWVGWSSLATLFFSPIAHYFSWGPMEKMVVGIQEPWVSCLIVLGAFVLYEQRTQMFSLLRRKAKLEAAAEEHKRYSHLLLASQNLLSTPLQVIEGTAHLIRCQHPEAASLVDRIERSFHPIREINKLLSFGRDYIEWDGLELPSSIKELEAEIKKLHPEENGQSKSNPALTLLPRYFRPTTDLTKTNSTPKLPLQGDVLLINSSQFPAKPR